MYEYAISFEIKSDATYAKRYGSLMDEIRKTPDGLVWEETTSFALLRSTETIEALADRLYFNSSISAATDILLIMDHARSVAIARGPIQYPATLKGHFEKCVIK